MNLSTAPQRQSCLWVLVPGDLDGLMQPALALSMPSKILYFPMPIQSSGRRFRWSAMAAARARRSHPARRRRLFGGAPAKWSHSLILGIAVLADLGIGARSIWSGSWAAMRRLPSSSLSGSPARRRPNAGLWLRHTVTRSWPIVSDGLRRPQRCSQPSPIAILRHGSWPDALVTYRRRRRRRGTG